jgi:hypothetical protein
VAVTEDQLVRWLYRCHGWWDCWAALGVVARVMIGKNRIMIYGAKDDGTYVVEFRTAEWRRSRQG